MKKLLLTGLLSVFAFAGIGLAETPKIVNPPRPIRKFKLMVVIKHAYLDYEGNEGLVDTHYVWVDNYHVMRYFSEHSGQWTYDFIPIGDSDWCADYGNGCVAEARDFDRSTGLIGLSSGFERTSRNNAAWTDVVLKSFLVAKAPKPRLSEQERRKMGISKTPPDLILQPQKAKVVFR